MKHNSLLHGLDHWLTEKRFNTILLVSCALVLIATVSLEVLRTYSGIEVGIAIAVLILALIVTFCAFLKKFYH